MTLADEAAELTEREAELTADEAADAAEDTALEAEEAAELAAELGIDETLEAPVVEAATLVAEEPAAVEEAPEAEALKQAVLDEDWTVNWPVVAVVPVES